MESYAYPLYLFVVGDVELGRTLSMVHQWSSIVPILTQRFRGLGVRFMAFESIVSSQLGLLSSLSCSPLATFLAIAAAIYVVGNDQHCLISGQTLYRLAHR